MYPQISDLTASLVKTHAVIQFDNEQYHTDRESDHVDAGEIRYEPRTRSNRPYQLWFNGKLIKHRATFPAIAKHFAALADNHNLDITKIGE